MGLKLTSDAFGPGERIPAIHTCEGEDRSPQLAWSGTPAGTRSLALICSDPDAPGGTWYHWAIFDLPADRSGLDEGGPKQARLADARQAITDFGRAGYGGPCPPKGHGIHHYEFRLLALDVAHLDVPDPAECRAVVAAASGHVLAEAILIGTYSR